MLTNMPHVRNQKNKSLATRVQFLEISVNYFQLKKPLSMIKIQQMLMITNVLVHFLVE